MDEMATLLAKIDLCILVLGYRQNITMKAHCVRVLLISSPTSTFFLNTSIASDTRQKITSKYLPWKEFEQPAEGQKFLVNSTA